MRNFRYLVFGIGVTCLTALGASLLAESQPHVVSTGHRDAGILNLEGVDVFYFLPSTPISTTSATCSCLGYCFTTDFVSCNAAGVYTSLTGPMQPFEVFNIRIVPETNTCAGGAAAAFPVSLNPGEAVTFEYMFTPDSAASFQSSATLTSDVGSFDLSVSGEAADGLCFYVTTDGFFGHVFVELIPDSGPQAGTGVRFGRYPTLRRYSAPGTINDDGETTWNRRICYPVSAAQYLNASQYIAGERDDPTDYNLKNENCVDFAEEVAARANLELPDTIGTFGASTPEALLQALENLGDHGKFSGGFVEFNAGKLFGIGDGPFDWDLDAVIIGSHDDPAQLALAMDLPLAVTDLGSFSTTLADGLTITPFNANAAGAIVSVQWGDGSSIDLLAEDFAEHSYASVGFYNGSLAVVNSGDVLVYEWSVTVTASASEAMQYGPLKNLIQITVPTPVPVETPNPGLVEPPEPPLIDEFFVDGFESGDTSAWSSTTGLL